MWGGFSQANLSFSHLPPHCQSELASISLRAGRSVPQQGLKSKVGGVGEIINHANIHINIHFNP